MSPRVCPAELCPLWDGGDRCCRAWGLDPPEPDADPTELPSATYERTERSR